MSIRSSQSKAFRTIKCDEKTAMKKLYQVYSNRLLHIKALKVNRPVRIHYLYESVDLLKFKDILKSIKIITNDF